MGGGSWENHKETPEKGDFRLSRPPIFDPATSVLSVQGRCLKFYDTFLRTWTKSTFFFIFKMIINCWDTRIQSYPTSASKIKSIKSSAWPYLYFLFTADGWNFGDTFLSPWTKSTFFLFFKILIRYWDTGVQSYFISACKIFGVARKRRVSRENAPIVTQKRLMCLK